MFRNRTIHIILVCLLALAVIWCALFYQMSYDRSLALSAAEISSANLAMAFEEHVKKSVENIDGLLLQLRDEYQRKPQGFSDRIRFLAEHKSVSELLIQVSVTDKQGVMTFNTIGMPAIPLNLSDREHFRIHLSGQDDRLHISKPVIGRVSKRWSIQFTRKIPDSAGSFAGMVVLSINPDYFSNYYKSIDVGPGGAITLLGMDGVIRARASKYSNSTEARGLTIPKDRVFLDSARPAAGIYKVPSAVDGVVRIGAYRRLQNYPLVVLVLRTEEDILHSVNERARQAYGVGSVLSFLVLLLGWAFWRNERQRADLLKELQGSQEELLDQNDELLSTEETLRTQIQEYQETHDQLLATEEMLREQLEVSEINQHLLSDSNNNLETMIHASPLAIISLDHAGRISLWNRAASTIFGCSAEDIGHTLKRLFASEEAYVEFINRLNTEQSLRLPEMPLQSSDSRPLVISLVSASLTSQTSAADFILMLEDVTKKIRLEEQMHQAQKMDVIGQLAGGIAHDFNNMLAGIMGSAELMKHRMTPDDTNMKLVDTILNAASRSAELTRELLVFSRKGVKESRPVALNDTITAVVGLLEHTIDKGIHLVARLEADSPVILGDPSLLQNALLNLGVNARDAMPEGGTLSYTTSLVSLNASDCKMHQTPLNPGSYLLISVSDTGIGIPRENMNRIFEPFFTTKEHGKGTGLGLAAVYGTIRDHKGSIIVYSEPGKGSVFNVYLPLCTSAAAEGAQNNTFIRGSGGILLVDDEEILRSIGRDLLEELGYTVYLAEDGERGLALYAQHRESIDLVMLDMIMPNLNGRESLLRLKKMNPDVRVLFCSGFHDEGTASELTQLGVRGLIQKPYNLIDLSYSVAAALQ
ncbi:MAG: response regulator [Desulfuromonadales bacterium]